MVVLVLVLVLVVKNSKSKSKVKYFVAATAAVGGCHGKGSRAAVLTSVRFLVLVWRCLA